MILGMIWLIQQQNKLINKMDMSMLLEASREILSHTERQIDALHKIYTHLADLDVLHSKLKLEKDKEAAESHQFSTLDAYSYFNKTALSQWNVGTPFWTFETHLPEVVAQAFGGLSCMAYGLRFFRWRSPDQSPVPGDFGICWSLQ